MKALLFSAGLGTRLKPFTNEHPKALAVVNNKTLLERNILYLKSFGFKDIVINVHHFGNQIVDFIKEHNNFGINIIISDETDKILETGGGMLKARKLLCNEDGDTNFLLMNVDILTDLKLDKIIKFHLKNKPLISLAVSERKSSRKLFFSEKKQLVGWKNYSNQENIFVDGFSEFNSNPLAFSGIHVLNSSVFDLLNKSEGDKFSIMEVYMELMKTNLILGYKHDANLVDVGKPESIKSAEKYFL